ncbi:MAG: hypothetical protein ACYTEQ_12800 [Planctomycetota bacterium]
MKSKWLIIAVPLGLWMFAANSGSKAVSPREIENVREKSVLSRADFEKIDSFVEEAVHELVRTKELSSISKLRTAILQQSTSNKASAQAQYTTQFYESAYKHIQPAFKNAAELPTEERKFVVTVNLLILADGLLANATDNPKLVDPAIERLQDENMVIRYWAVRVVTNPQVIKRLKSGNSRLARRIIDQLRSTIESSCPEIVVLTAEFAADLNTPQADELLLLAAGVRIKKYADWTADYEASDVNILKSLCKRILAAGENETYLARSFGQFYSSAIQRYIRGRDYLNDTQKQQLGSLLVEIEDKCVRQLLQYQTDIKTAVGREDFNALWRAHNALSAQLAQKYKFRYVDQNGNERQTPVLLPEPPQTRTSQ